MSNERGPKVNPFQNNLETNNTPEKIVEHLQRMGLKTGGLVMPWVEFVEFEISQPDRVSIKVKRPDGNLTRCYLTANDTSGEKDFVYLQVDSKVDPEEHDFGAEVHGIFPVAIVAIRSASHHGKTSFTTLDFVTENGGAVGVTSDGNIDFSQGKF